MPDSKRVEIEIRRDLDLTKRTWLVAGLLRRYGIFDVRFHPDDHSGHLSVDYDPAWFSPLTLCNLIKQQGVDAAVSTLQRSDHSGARPLGNAHSPESAADGDGSKTSPGCESRASETIRTDVADRPIERVPA